MEIGGSYPGFAERGVSHRWKEMRRALLRSHERVRRRYNAGRVPNPFKVSQLVYCRSHPLSSRVEGRAAKLCYRWMGPFRISKFVSPVTASLVGLEDGMLVRVAHVSPLKACPQVEVH